MTNSAVILIGVTFYIIGIALITGVLYFIRNKSKTTIRHEINDLEKNKNLIINSEILTEINRVENLINNKDLEEKFNIWKSKFNDIKDKDIPLLTDMLIEIENILDTNDFKKCMNKLGEVELKILEVRSKSDSLLNDIKNITLSEKRNRSSITILKSKYREIITKFNNNKLDYKNIMNTITLQFENIDKLFSAFEIAMEKNKFDEVSKIVKGVTDLVNNMEVIIEETPSIILLANGIIPKKINDIQLIYNRMTKNGYNLEYLNLDYNVNETKNQISDVLDRLNVLNVSDSLFLLKTTLNYYESIYSDFDNEKICKKKYENSIEQIETKINRLTKIIKNLYNNLNDLQKTYDLTNEEIKGIDNLSKEIYECKNSFKNVADRTRTKLLPFSKLSNESELLLVKTNKIEDTLDLTLRTLGSLKDDELRAREQLDEIKNILRDALYKIKEYKLAFVPKNYYVELSEASESIKEIAVELEKKPIKITALNIRVDTSRDLVLKLYNTCNILTKTAAMAELAIVYGNKYRSSYKEINIGLTKAENEFFKGEYKSSLEIAINTIDTVEPGIHKKLLSKYDN